MNRDIKLDKISNFTAFLPKQLCGHNVPAERLQVTFATPPRSPTSPLQPGCYAATVTRRVTFTVRCLAFSFDPHHSESQRSQKQELHLRYELNLLETSESEQMPTIPIVESVYERQ